MPFRGVRAKAQPCYADLMNAAQRPVWLRALPTASIIALTVLSITAGCGGKGDVDKHVEKLEKTVAALEKRVARQSASPRCAGQPRVALLRAAAPGSVVAPTATSAPTTPQKPPLHPVISPAGKIAKPSCAWARRGSCVYRNSIFGTCCAIIGAATAAIACGGGANDAESVSGDAGGATDGEQVSDPVSSGSTPENTAGGQTRTYAQPNPSPVDPDGGLPVCVPDGNVDEPDEEFADTDCDGINGEALRAVFVSPQGSDAASGDMASPVQS